MGIRGEISEDSLIQITIRAFIPFEAPYFIQDISHRRTIVLVLNIMAGYGGVFDA